jgi:hypothetical protein
VRKDKDLMGKKRCPEGGLAPFSVPLQYEYPLPDG